MADTALGDAASAASEPGDASAVSPGGHGRLGRRELLTLISMIMAMMAVGIDLMLPAFNDIEAAYGLRGDAGQLGQIVTVYFFGLAVAQLVYGPLADSFGRKRVLYASVIVYIAGAVISALAPTYAMLLVGRFVWGVGAAGGRVVATAVIRDRFEGVAMAKAMSQIMAVFVLVPVFAPAFGAGIIAFLPWRSLFWFCALFGLAIAIWSLRLSETLNPAHRRPLDAATTMRGYAQVARTPITFGYTVAALFLQAVFTAYISASESIVDEVFDMGPQFPFVFGAVAILFGVAAIVNGRIVERLGIDGVVNRTFAFMIPTSLLLIAISVVSGGQPSIWIYMPVLGATIASFMFLMPNLGSAAMVPVGEIAGSASAFTGAFRTAGGALLATLVAGWVDASTTGFAIWVAVCCIAAGLTVVIVRRRAVRRAASSIEAA